MSNITYVPPIGRLAVDRYRFRDHINGDGYRHNAAAIDLDPLVVLGGATQSTVQDALEAISSDIGALFSAEKTLILVGDGYDTYHNSLSNPDNPYDSAIPAFDGYLNDILNNTANPNYFRIRSGGIVLIKAGTYKFTGTVNVPAGIILMGEGYGTKIANQTSSPLPLFKIKADSTRIPDGGVDSTETFIFCKETIFINLTIADNFLEPKSLGDVSYKTPKNNNSSTPLIALEEGASLSCENVRLVGKTTYSLGAITNITSFAIATDSTTPVTNGTRLKISNSSIDGFAVPVKFTASGKINDHFSITNTLVRGYGYLNNDFASAANNTLFKLNACNISIVNNYCFGYDNTVTSLAYITPFSSPPVAQGKAKINISSNNIAIDRSSNTPVTNATFRFIRYSGSLNSSVAVAVFGNNIDNLSNLYLDSTVRLAVKTISSTPYTIDTTTVDYVILVDSSSVAITINLPDITDTDSTNGRILIIKDNGSASTNNITLARNGGVGQIEGLSSNYVMDASFQTVQLTAISGNWWFTG